MTRHFSTANSFATRLALAICWVSLCASGQSSGSSSLSLREVPSISVTPNRSGAKFTQIALQRSGFAASNVTAEELLNFAYGVSPYALDGAPDWLATDKFDVQVVESQGNPSLLSPADIQEHRKVLVRTLLAEAFKLRFHTVNTLVAGYSLTKDSRGVRIAIHDPLTWSSGRILNNKGQIDITALPISSLARELSETMGVPVADRTGLAGNYDVSLSWDKNSPAGDGPLKYGPLASALREQLGLELVPEQQNLERFVIDNIAGPGN
jgi:uncharacterized protein (TIGR03435 family)